MFTYIKGFKPEILGALPKPISEIYALDISDKVLLATTKLLLFSRLNENEVGGVSSANWWAFPDCAFGTNTTYTKTNFPNISENTVGVYNIYDNISSDYKDNIFKFLDKRYLKDTKDGNENFAIEKFFEQQGMRARVYIHKAQKKTMIFVDGHTYVLLEHLIASMIPALMPWLFETKPVEPWEKDILLAINDDSPNKFMTLFSKAMARLNFKAMYLERALNSFENGLRTKKIETIDSRITDSNYTLEDLENRIVALLRERQHYEDERRGLIERLDDTSNGAEIFDFFKNSKVIDLVDASDGRLSFMVATELNNYDIDLAEDYIDNPRSVFYRYNANKNINTETWKKVLKAIFIDRTIKIHIACQFNLNFYDGTFRMVHETLPTNPFSADCVPNPHLKQFNCLGNNRVPLIHAVQSCDYITALSICIASTGNLNLSETINVENFLSYLFCFKNEMCELPNGRRCTFKDAIAWLEQEEPNEQGN